MTSEGGSGWRPEIRVIRSAQRRRTVSAQMVGGVLEVRVPSWMSAQDREQWVERMRERIQRKVERADGDRDLDRRAQMLNQRLFGGQLRWSSIGWAEQRRRWASCSPGSAGIRISTRAARLPDWVLDYLLVHELSHLLEANHGRGFWDLVNRYPLTERARGYLMALDHMEGQAAKA